MAETFSETRYDMGEQDRIEEMLSRLSKLETFVRENPNSPLLPHIAAILREVRPASDEEVEENGLSESGVNANEMLEAEEVDLPAEKEQEEPFPRMTFEQARMTPRPLSDKFIEDGLKGTLQKPGGERAFSVKSYFDMVPADDSDKEFSKNHDQVIAFHDGLTDFVAAELKLFSSPRLQSYLKERRQVFTDKLEAGKAAFRKYVDGREKRLDLKTNEVPWDVLEFHGLTVPTSSDRYADLLVDKVDGIYSNLYMQRNIGGLFVHWSSEQFVQEKAAGKRPELTRRIYLNPRAVDSVKVFSDVVHALDGQGFAAKAKIYDRTSDSDVMKRYDSVKETFGVRGDSIVVYATEEEADDILAAVERVCDKHKDAFEGRELTSVPFKIGPGIGLGDEPKAKNESLTSHRAKVIVNVFGEVQKSGETDPQKQIDSFRTLWRSHALGENINPDNPAFNT